MRKLKTTNLAVVATAALGLALSTLRPAAAQGDPRLTCLKLENAS